MGKRVWEKCLICLGDGGAFPGSQHPCGACRGTKGKWVEKSDDNGGCLIPGLAIIIGTAVSTGFGITKAVAAIGLF